MDGNPNTFSAFFASADFSDNDAGAGLAKINVENLPEYRDIKLVVENLLQATLNAKEDGVKSVSDYKLELKKLLCVENLSLMESFLKPVEENDSYTKILQISETLSNKMFNSYSKDIFQSLNIDLSDNIVDFEQTIGIDSSLLRKVLDDFNKKYKESLENLFKADFDIRNALDQIQKIIKHVNIVTELDTNEITNELLGSVSKYIHKSIENIKLYDLFHNFISARKTFVAYRNLMQIKNVTEHVENEPICSICMAEPIKQVCVPCGHSFCNTCMSKQYICYICRCKVEKKIRLFLS